MSFVVVGCSYRTAGVELRERLAVSRDDLGPLLDRLTGLAVVDECMLVSTCNRVEAYASTARPAAAQGMMLEQLAAHAGIDADDLGVVAYRFEDEEALLHIFRVAASLDAMVVGEAQVTGQVKDAFAAATDRGALGPLLTRGLQRAFLTAKRVRTETAIARYPASVSSVAVDLAGHIFGDLGTVATLIVGAGEMAELAARHLIGHGASRLRVANRSPEHAERLCAELGAKPVPFAELAEQLLWADVVICSTGSERPILERATLARAMKLRKQRPLAIVDIAVPRDVEPKARKLANLYLFDVDDLERVVAENIRARRKEAKVAERIVAAEVGQFRTWLRAQRAVPVIKQLRQRFADVAHGEAERAAKVLGLNGASQHALDQMADAIVNKLLHSATVELKRDADERNAQLADAAKRLFDLRPPAGDAEGDG